MFSSTQFDVGLLRNREQTHFGRRPSLREAQYDTHPIPRAAQLLEAHHDASLSSIYGCRPTTDLLSWVWKLGSWTCQSVGLVSGPLLHLKSSWHLNMNSQQQHRPRVSALFAFIRAAYSRQTHSAHHVHSVCFHVSTENHVKRSDSRSFGLGHTLQPYRGRRTVWNLYRRLLKMPSRRRFALRLVHFRRVPTQDLLSRTDVSGSPTKTCLMTLQIGCL